MNAQQELDQILAGILSMAPNAPTDTADAQTQAAAIETPPRLLLHSCCGPCSSYVLEYLSAYFSITLLYYNPNIQPQEEYQKRLAEQKRLIAQMPLPRQVTVVEGVYDPERFDQLARGLEHLPEGGERCTRCYELRLREAAIFCKEQGCDYFGTTLSVSPYKNAEKLNEIGRRLQEEYGVRYLPSDFKKKNGYQRSIALSKEYGLYRQPYCGCLYSKKMREERLHDHTSHPERTGND